jgi:hypothetical protein
MGKRNKTAQLPNLVQKSCTICAVKTRSDFICRNIEFVFVAYIVISMIEVADATIGCSAYLPVG